MSEEQAYSAPYLTLSSCTTLTTAALLVASSPRVFPDLSHFDLKAKHEEPIDMHTNHASVPARQQCPLMSAVLIGMS